MLGVAGVQKHSKQSCLGLGARVPRYPVQASSRFVKRVTNLERLDWLVVDRPLIFPFQDITENRPRMTVRLAGVARLNRHLDHRRPRILPIQLLHDVPLGNCRHLYFAVTTPGLCRRSGIAVASRGASKGPPGAWPFHGTPRALLPPPTAKVCSAMRARATSAGVSNGGGSSEVWSNSVALFPRHSSRTSWLIPFGSFVRNLGSW